MSLGPGKMLAEQRTKLSSVRKKNFQDQEIEKGVSDLFKDDPSIQLSELTKILWVCENISFRHIQCNINSSIFMSE